MIERWLDRADPSDAELEPMVRSLAAGGLWAFPTDTVWGLGCRADRAETVARIFAAKGRDEGKPMACLVDSLEGLEAALPFPMPAGYRELARASWPGAVTLVLECPAGFLEAPRRGAPGIGFRVPDHPTLRRVIRAAGIVLAATSANRSGEPVLTRAADVVSTFGPLLDGILEAPPAPHGRASKVLVWRPDGAPGIVRA